MGRDAAFTIRIGTIIGFVLRCYPVWALVYLRIEFDESHQRHAVSAAAR